MKKIIIVCCLFFSYVGFSQNYINHKGNNIFLSGINLAWMEFGNDLTQFNEENFTRIIKNVSEAGGNSVRWWIHVDGRSTPTFEHDTVVGISELALTNLGKALDIAAEEGIVISLCLWSFDMMHLERSQAVRDRNRILLENERALDAYIEKALIPMVSRFAGHTAILCWEIFNEPEGMTPLANWAITENVDMIYIQRFINRTAGAIHRADSEAKVSNGSWNALACVDSLPLRWKNYYSDAELIAAGGDVDGTLDFYMLHYYQQHYGNRYSPFHNPIEYWKLDKPLLIGEYAAHGVINNGKGFAPTYELDATESLMYLFNNGYAGGWGWTYTNHDGNGGLPDMLPVLDSLKTTYPLLIQIPRDPNHNYAPVSLAIIPDTVVYVNSHDIPVYVNLNDYFSDEQQLLYEVDTNGPAQLFVENDSLLRIAFIPDSVGISTFTVLATDVGGKSVTSRFNIVVRDSVLVSDNKLLFALVSSSSEENEEHRRVFVNDGDITTRWSSVYNDAEWLQFDMVETHEISRIVLHWEAAYGDQYDILSSLDAVVWDTIASVGRGKSEINNIVFPAKDMRYIKIVFNKRATAWGYSLFEVEAFADNQESLNQAPVAISSLPDVSMAVGYNLRYQIPANRFFDANDDVLHMSAELLDGNLEDTWLSFDAYSQTFHGVPQLSDTGTYTVRITASDWFSQTATHEFSFIVNVPVAISPLKNNSLTIYPNPCTSHTCTLQLNNTYSGTAHISFINMFGLLAYTQVLPCVNGALEIALPEFLHGVYMVKLTLSNNQYVGKIMVK